MNFSSEHAAFEEMVLVLRRGRRGNANDQACGRDDAIVGPEHRCSQPPDATDEVFLRVQAKTTHLTFCCLGSQPSHEK